MSDSLRAKLAAVTCAGCRAGEPVEYIAGYKAHRKMNIVCHSQAETLLPIIESEINQARLAEAERAPHGNDCLSFNHDRSATGLDCSCARGKRIAQLSSVQQEASKPSEIERYDAGLLGAYEHYQSQIVAAPQQTTAAQREESE